MSLHVKTKMITSGKSSITKMTLEWFASCVFSMMSSQLVRSCKLPITSFPATQIWLFSCMGPFVSFKMTALSVDLK